MGLRGQTSRFKAASFMSRTNGKMHEAERLDDFLGLCALAGARGTSDDDVDGLKRLLLLGVGGSVQQ